MIGIGIGVTQVRSGGGGGQVTSGLMLDLDTSTLNLADAAAIATWPDRSGNSKDGTQPTAGKQPSFRTNVINGLPVVRFDGGDGLVTPTIDLTASGQATVFLVIRPIAGGDGFLLESSTNFTGSNNAFAISRLVTSNLIRCSQHGAAGYNVWEGGAVANAAPTLISAIMDRSGVATTSPSAETQLWLNGAGVGGFPNTFGTGLAETSLGNLAFNIGSRDSAGTGSLFYNGDIAKILLYNRVLTGTERHTNERLLALRYALPWTLTSNIVFDGDSHTAGFGQSPTTNYPAVCVAGLASSGAGVSYVNLGGSSQTVASMVADAATQVDPQLSTLSPKNVAIIWGGGNDHAAGANAATVLSRLETWGNARKAAGFQTVVCTMLPASAAGWNTLRATVNAALRTSLAFDAVADLAANTTIGEDADNDNLTNYAADALHLNATGAAIAAGIVRTALGTLGIT